MALVNQRLPCLFFLSNIHYYCFCTFALYDITEKSMTQQTRLLNTQFVFCRRQRDVQKMFYLFVACQCTIFIVIDT